MHRKNKTGNGQRVVGRTPSTVLLWSAIAVGMLPIAALFLLYLPPIQKALLTSALERIERSANIKIEYAAFRWAPLHRLGFQGVSVRLLSGVKFLESEEIELRYRPSLGWPFIRPIELHLIKPVIHLEKDSEGNWILLQQSKASPPEPDAGGASVEQPCWMTVPLPKLLVESARIEGFQDGRQVLLIRNITGALSFSRSFGPNGPRLGVDLDRWRGEAVMPEWGGWKVSGTAQLGASDATLTDVRIDFREETHICIEGQWTFRGSQTGRLLNVRLEPLMQSTFPELTARLPHLEWVSGLLAVHQNGEGWEVEHDIYSNLGRLTGILDADFPATPSLKISWGARFDNLTIPTSDRIPANSFQGDFDIAVEGASIEDAVAKAIVRLGPSHWGPEAIRKAEFAGSCDKGLLSVDKCDVQSSLGSFRLNGSGDIKGLWDPKHEGDMHAQLTTEKVHLDEFLNEAKQQMEGSATIAVRYGAGLLTDWMHWDAQINARISAPRFLSLDFSGELKNERMNASYFVSVEDMQKLSGFFSNWHGKGKAASKGVIQGKWPDIEWKGELNARHFEYDAVQIEQADLDGSAGLTGKDDHRLLRFKVQGMTAGGRRIKSLNGVVEQRQDDLNFQFRSDGVVEDGGMAQLTGILHNLWSAPRELAIMKGLIGWKDLKCAIDGKIKIDENFLSVEHLDLSRGQEHMRWAGTVAASGQFKGIEASFEGVSIGEWAALCGASAPLKGAASGKITVSGGMEEPRISLDMQLAGLEYRNTPIGQVVIQGVVGGGQLQAQGDLYCKASEHPIHLTARAPLLLSLKPPHLQLRPDDAMSVSLKASDVHLASFHAYAPFLSELDGVLDADLNFYGLTVQPRMRGTAVVRGGAMEFKDWPHPMTNIHLLVEADADRLYIREGSLNLLGGRAELSGSTDIALERMDLHAIGTDIVFPEIFGIEGKGPCKVSFIGGLMEKPRIEGSAALTYAKMSLNDLETDIAQDITVVTGKENSRVLEVKGRGVDPGRFVNRFEMDLDLRLPPAGTWVRGKGLDAEVAGAMRLTKASGNPLNFLGDFQALRGTYTFQDTRMNIVEGELMFRGGPRPDLRVLGQKESGDATIQALVSGPLLHPKLALSSIPAMDQVDILSYLFFGRPATKLNSRENVALHERAAFWFGSDASDVMKKVLGYTPINPDVVRLRASDDGASGVVEVGKYLTPDLYVTYEKELEKDMNDQVRLEYRLSRSVSVQSQFGGEKQSGVDVFWQYDFGE